MLEELRIANENCIKNAKIKDNPFVAIWEKQNRAIEHILSDYKRVLKENEILKEEKEQAWEEWNNLEQGSYEIEQKLEQQIKKLQKENEELKEKNREHTLLISPYYVKENYIPVQKVKDKIEELNNISNAEKLEDIMIGENYTITELVQYVLRELIEGEN